jgi:hypothetical protein
MKLHVPFDDLGRQGPKCAPTGGKPLKDVIALVLLDKRPLDTRELSSQPPDTV